MVFASLHAHGAFHHNKHASECLMLLDDGAYDIDWDKLAAIEDEEKAKKREEARRAKHPCPVVNEAAVEKDTAVKLPVPTAAIADTAPVAEAKHSTVKRSYTCSRCGAAISGDGKLGLCSKCVGMDARKVDHPSADELRELVWPMPTTKVAERYGVSDKAVDKWCKAAGVGKPPRGYWAKKAAEEGSQTVERRHGTYYSYTKGCRCELCLAANDRRNAQDRARYASLSEEEHSSILAARREARRLAKVEA